MLHARRLMTALQATAPKQAAAAFIHSPTQLTAASEALCACFACDPRLAPLLLAATSGGQTSSDSAAAPYRLGPAECSSAGAMLPRLPMGLALITSEATYEAIAGVARCFGRLASLAGGTALRCLATATGASHTGDLESLVQSVGETFVQEGLWGVPTSLSPNHAAATADAQDESQQRLTPQVLAENAVLARALLEGVGVCARACGPRFASSGKLLRQVLLPLLERLGDGCTAVAAAAHDVLACLCANCGYAGQQALVEANTDYIVDALCSQLRAIDRHPRAPALFAALLSMAGVPAALLPLLAEPARAAMRGLAISTRHRRPQHTASFLRVLVQVNTAARTEGVEVLAAMQAAARQVKVAAELQEQQGLSSCSEPAASMTAPADAATASADEPSAQANGGHMQVIHDYFKADENEESKITWTAQQWQAAEGLRARAHAAAMLANSAADVSAPLVTASDLQVAVLALDVATGALAALQPVAAAREIREQQIEPMVRRQPGHVAPLPPDTPQLLPQVHLVWGPLMAALKDPRLPVVERGANSLLLTGEAEATTEVQPHAPGAIDRARTAVMRAIASIAASASAGEAMVGMAFATAEELTTHIGTNRTPALREAACQAILCLARRRVINKYINECLSTAESPTAASLVKPPNEGRVVT
ncbi:hypothetical protein WJX73_002626 [Symbiochloris irregularis]|uniref:Uncharacterized protein n=1 Tax=Symbiochloris irregularis TaxID=706552 RepID=A0AAW1NK04_9CHLO